MYNKLTFHIYRFDPSINIKGYFQEYSLDYNSKWTILDYLNHIKSYLDTTLTFRKSCGHAICGSCAMTINKKNRLACHTHIIDIGKSTITIEPLKSFPIIKDLVVDMTEFFEKISATEPWLQPNRSLDDKEMTQSQQEWEKIKDAANCILCGACTSSCPSYWSNSDYLGPAALYKAYRYVFDSRDAYYNERLSNLNDKNALFKCHTIFNCVEACPKNLNPTSGISELKKASIKEHL